MQLLCSTGTFSRYPEYPDYRNVLKYASQLEVDGFELLFYPNWYPQLARITTDLQRSGLHFPVIHAEKDIGTALGSSQRERREQAVQWLALNCQFAQSLGATIIV
ncbi:MAG: sugar phosphate isomerase/epimerase, partial [Chloroflexota bacterium]|nr:sugar phosphate isomerase/epimerase [Chloroflexota bacterium]